MSIRMTTYSGRTIDLQAMSADDIYIEDIAHGLSQCCRYIGQCREFYSVAEHSTRMATYLGSEGYASTICLAALLHDASEAYIGDMHTDLKAILPMYKELEGVIMNIIFTKYGIPYEPQSAYMKIVKDLDIKIRTAEVGYLLRGVDKFSWGLVPFEYTIEQTRMPKVAERGFLDLFKHLKE